MGRNLNFSWCFLLSLCLFSFATASKWLDILSTQLSGTIFKFTNDHVSYLIHPIPTSYVNLDVITFAVAGNASLHLPATSIHVDGNTPRITRKFLRSQLDKFSEIDDVWNRQFLKSVILYYGGQTPATIDDQANIWLRNQGVTTLFLSGSIERPAREAVPTYKLPHKVDVGPVVISRQNVGEGTHLAFHNVYRLYLDEYESFLFGAIPDLIHGGWILTNFTVPTDSDDGIALQLIPVPSRLNSLLTPHFHLAGIRFGLKDIYHAQGLPTAAGSIAYQLTHDVPLQDQHLILM